MAIDSISIMTMLSGKICLRIAFWNTNVGSDSRQMTKTRNLKFELCSLDSANVLTTEVLPLGIRTVLQIPSFFDVIICVPVDRKKT